jgi:WD40 repeat protein
VDALDEAASAQDRRQIAETLVELAMLSHVRIAVATRPLAADERERYRPRRPLPELEVASASSTNLVDLDTDRYFDEAGLRQFAAALLAQEGADRPGPPGGAWRHYRTHPDLQQRLAATVAARAGRNHLVAAMAAVPLSTRSEPVDPTAPDFDVRTVPSGVGEALGKYLDALPELERLQTQGLLTALAYARGSGIDDSRWLRFAATLGYRAETIHLERLRRSVAADYLLQAVAGEAGIVTRLFHQALVDELLGDRPAAEDERLLCSALLHEATSAGWEAAPDYLRAHLGAHAATAGMLPTLLGETGYLAVADLPRLMSLVASGADADSAVGQVIRQSGNRAAVTRGDRRIDLFALTAAHLGHLDVQERMTAASGTPVRLRWAHSLGAFHRELPDSIRDTSALTVGRLGRRDVVVTGSGDGEIRFWDGSGRLLRGPFPAHAGYVGGLAVGRLGRRDTLVSAGGRDGTVRIWDLDRTDIAPAPALPVADVRLMAVQRLGDQDVVVTAGKDKVVRIWDAATRQPVGAPLAGHTADIRALVIGRIGDREVLVSADRDSAVRSWEPLSGEPVGEPLGPLAGLPPFDPVVTIGRIGAQYAVACARTNGDVVVREVIGGRALCKIERHHHAVEATAIGRIAGHDAVVTLDRVGTIRVWDGIDGGLHTEIHTGATGSVSALELGRLGSRDVIVPLLTAEPVRIWEGNALPASPDALPGHTRRVRAVTLGRAGGSTVVFSASDDGTIRRWDAGNGRPAGMANYEQVFGMTHLDVRELDGKTVVVAGSEDSHIRLFDTELRLLCEPTLFKEDPDEDDLEPHSLVALALGRKILVSAHFDDEVDVRTARNLRRIGAPLPCPGIVRDLAVGQLEGREVIVAGSSDGSLRIWRHRKGKPDGRPVTVQADRDLTAVAIGRFAGADAIATGAATGTVRIWTPRKGGMESTTVGSHAGLVDAVTVGRVGGRDVLVSAGADHTVRIWWGTAQPPVVLDFLRRPVAVGLSADGILCVAAGTAVCAFRHVPEGELPGVVS